MTSDPAFFASAKNRGPRDDALAGLWHPPTETWPLVCLATPGEKDQRVLTDMAEGADQRRSDAGCLGQVRILRAAGALSGSPDFRLFRRPADEKAV